MDGGRESICFWRYDVLVVDTPLTSWAHLLRCFSLHAIVMALSGPRGPTHTLWWWYQPWSAIGAAASTQGIDDVGSGGGGMPE